MLSVFLPYLKGQNMKDSSKSSNRSWGESVVPERQVRWTDKKNLFQAGEGEDDVTPISDDRWDADIRVTLE